MTILLWETKSNCAPRSPKMWRHTCSSYGRCGRSPEYRGTERITETDEIMCGIKADTGFVESHEIEAVVEPLVRCNLMTTSASGPVVSACAILKLMVACKAIEVKSPRRSSTVICRKRVHIRTGWFFFEE